MWNISKFISSFPVVEEEPLETDKWILSELSTVIDESLDGYSDYNFFVPANKVREFIWNIFAPHYIELVKQRAYGIDFDEKSKRAAWSTLHICLKNSLLLLAPIVPFITDKIWREVYSDQSIHKQIFQKNEFKYEFKESTEKIIEFNSLIWNKKKQMGISLKNEISENVPKELKVFKKDLEAMHKLR